MSRLIDKLTRLRQIEPQPIGFAALGKPAAEKPRMQLLVSLPPDKQDSYSDLLNSADAALIAVAKSKDLKAVEKACQAKDSIPAGGWVRATDPETLQKVIEAACDFVVFPSTSSLTLTQKDKMGRIIELDPSLADGLLRTVNDLPVDAALVSMLGKDDQITLDRLMQIRRLVFMINKPVLVSIPDNLTVPELQAIWDMGVSGVIVEAADEQSAEKLAQLRKAIEQLTPSAIRKKEKTSPILPQMRAETPPPREDEEEEDE